jgi:Ca2+-transporting ATPase
VRRQLELNMCLNSKAFVIDKGASQPLEFVGNRTECALLVLAGKWGADYRAIREEYESGSRVVQVWGGAGRPAGGAWIALH